MKRILTALTLFFCPALAHDTVNAGNVTLEWHTDTNELLQVDGDTTFTFSMTNKGQHIALTDCRCTLLLYAGEVSPRVKPTVLILKNGEEGGISALISVTQPGPYSLVLDAKPRDIQRFTAFRTVIHLNATQDVYNAPAPPENAP